MQKFLRRWASPEETAEVLEILQSESSKTTMNASECRTSPSGCTFVQGKENSLLDVLKRWSKADDVMEETSSESKFTCATLSTLITR